MENIGNFRSFRKSNNKQIHIPRKLTRVPGCVRTVERILTHFQFPETPDSDIFWLLVICSCISLFTCDSIVFPCFMLLFSFMYSGLLSVPGTYLSHSLVYKYLYSVARTPELRLLLLFSFWSPEFPRSLTLRNPGSLRDSTGNRAIP